MESVYFAFRAVSAETIRRINRLLLPHKQLHMLSYRNLWYIMSDRRGGNYVGGREASAHIGTEKSLRTRSDDKVKSFP